MVKFVIQYNMLNEGQLQVVKDALVDLPHIFVGIIPFSRDITSDEELVGTEYIPYGSTLMTTIVDESMGWEGLHFDVEKFTYSEAVRNRHDMLNEGRILTIGEAITFFKLCQDDELWFIRPDKDLKQFSGHLITSKDAREFLFDAVTCVSSGTYRLSEDELVVVAKPTEILAEWRWFIIGGRIIDGAMYKAHNQLVKRHEEDEKVIFEAQTFANYWLPNECCVMDLALTNEGVKVIEFNCINASGFYGHDAKKIFASLYEYHGG